MNISIHDNLKRGFLFASANVAEQNLVPQVSKAMRGDMTSEIKLISVSKTKVNGTINIENMVKKAFQRQVFQGKTFLR